jgi:hypothetical protein
MKLERFIENYQRAVQTPLAHSPDRPHVFRTSESIGTLNSRDEFTTDRSYVLHPPLPVQPPQTHSIHHSFGATFNSHYAPNLPVGEAVDELSVDTLYEEPPSQAEEGGWGRAGRWGAGRWGEEREEVGRVCEELERRMGRVQQENMQLEEEWLRAERIGVQQRWRERQLEDEVGRLREAVRSAIQESIEIENSIKEVLLREEMEKYRGGGLECLRQVSPLEARFFATQL